MICICGALLNLHDLRVRRFERSHPPREIVSHLLLGHLFEARFFDGGAKRREDADQEQDPDDP
jgi:hypothetical protein